MSLLLDGTDDNVDHGSVTGINAVAALSGCLWVMPVALDVSDGFFSKGTGAAQFKFGTHHTTNTQVDVWFDNVPVLGRTGNVLTAGVWTHCGFTFNGSGGDNASRLQIQINGVAQSLTFEGTIPATTPNNTTASLFTGRNIVNSKFANFRFAHFRLWGAHLTAREIQAEMHSYKPRRTANLLIAAPYDDATSARDYSGRGFHGTVTGATYAAGPPISFGSEAMLL